MVEYEDTDKQSIMIFLNALSPNVFTIKKKKKHRLIIQIDENAVTDGKRPEYFLKNKMFCIILKAYKEASEILKILCLGLSLVQREASLISNDLGTDSTS